MPLVADFILYINANGNGNYMSSKRKILRNLGIAVLASGLVACNGADERKAKYMEEGKQLMEAGDYEKAQLAFKNVIQIDPKYWESHFQMAEALSKQGKIENAFKEYSAIVANDENHVMARVRVGQLMLLNRSVDEAEKLVNQALAKEANNVEALVLMAGVQVAKNDTATALTTVQKALQISPDDVAATLMRSSLFLRENKAAEAIGLLKQLISKKADNIPLRTMLVGILAKNNQMADAEQQLQEIIKIKPEEVQSYRNLALFQTGTNQLDKAEATLRDAMQKLPDNEAAKSNLIDFLVEKRSLDVAMSELQKLIASNPQAYGMKFKLAAMQLSNKQLEPAEATLKQVVEQDKLGPSGIIARNKLAAIYTATKRIDEARVMIKDVLEANPRDAEALSMRGQFALADNKTAEAISDFRSVLVDQPNNIGVLKSLAAAHLRNNEPELARENMEKVVNLAPNDEVARLDLVGLQVSAGQEEQARQQLADLLKANPKSLKGLEASFKLEVVKKRWDKAQEFAKTAQQTFPDEPVGAYMSGLGYQAEGKYEQAATAFEQALAKKPDGVEPLTELVKTYMALKQPAKAIAQLQQAVKLHPDHFIAYNQLGGVYLSEQKFAEAKTAFNKALEIKPEWFAPYRSLALSELMQKNNDAAIGLYKKGIEKTNGAIELVEDLARVYHQSGKHQDVVALYEDSLKRYPDSPLAANNLASYLSDYVATPENLERAAKLAEPLAASSNPSFVDTVGWIAYKLNNLDKAKEMLEKAVQLDANAPINNYHLGMTYFKRNEKTKAAELLQKAVDAKVNFFGIEEAKQTLELAKQGS